MTDDDNDGITCAPTPGEITEACRLIQSGWTDQERRRRRTRQPAKSVDTKGVEAIARQRLEVTLLTSRQGDGWDAVG